ncbi:hypothetical protein Lal_00041774 [Lupinus albus]|nr:hypothetical protein Lal_00041774 [Lupinus albus]
MRKSSTHQGGLSISREEKPLQEKKRIRRPKDNCASSNSKLEHEKQAHLSLMVSHQSNDERIHETFKTLFKTNECHRYSRKSESCLEKRYAYLKGKINKVMLKMSKM